MPEYSKRDAHRTRNASDARSYGATGEHHSPCQFHNRLAVMLFAQKSDDASGILQLVCGVSTLSTDTVRSTPYGPHLDVDTLMSV